jgi:hypothetical protein
MEDEMKNLAIGLLVALAVMFSPATYAQVQYGTVYSLSHANVNATTVIVGDGLSPTDCTTGGGHTAVLCYKTAAGTWAPSATVPAISAAPGDLVCASAGDTTIGSQSITGGSSTTTTATVSMSAVPAYMYPGANVVVASSSPTGYNVTSAPIVSTTSTSVTYSTTNNPASWVSGGTIALACANVADATFAAPSPFTNSYSIPANTVAAGSTYRPTSTFAYFSSSTAPTVKFGLYYGSTQLYINTTGLVSPTSAVGAISDLTFDAFAVSPTLMTGAIQSIEFPTSTALSGLINTTEYYPVPVTTTSLAALQVEVGWNPTGVVSGTYTSGITATGTVGQTCTLTSFNNSSTATATVALTGTNTIAASTALVITSKGQAATAAPTSATAGSGTATCSGTATIVTVLGGAPGNAAYQYSNSTRL